MDIPKYAVRDSVRQIDATSWLVGYAVVLARVASPPADQPSWSDDEGGFYTLSAAPDPLPASTPLLLEGSPLDKVYDAGIATAVWRAGDAFVKVHREYFPDATPEHVTLAAVRARGYRSFSLPEALYHGTLAGSGYSLLVVRRLPGLMIEQLWPKLDADQRSTLVARVADICMELATWTGDSGTICGVDGRHVAESLLTGAPNSHTCDPASMRRHCEAFGLDCSTLGFYHGDLGPTNIVVDFDAEGAGTIDDAAIGIIDWENAGFMPRDWIRTKFHLHGGLDFDVDDFEERVAWRRQMGLRLGTFGLRNLGHEWMAWRNRINERAE